jgi:hypothetical protein
MRLPVRFRVAAQPPRLSAGLLRLGILSLFVVLVAMIRPRLTHWSAGWLVLVGGLAVVAGGLLFLAATRRIALRLPFVEHRATEAVLLLIRRLGLPLLGLLFFLLWTFVYIGIWWVHPHSAFTGLARHPRFADFFYTAVSTAFVSPPGDILARSRGARAETMIEMLTAFALVTAYASSFLDFQRASPSEDLS